jgi:peptidoglycan/xylan/chitin deacetylase (PgdA/CDA1 family)
MRISVGVGEGAGEMKGKLTVSIDIELAWGVWDHLTAADLRLVEGAERPIFNALIELFDRHGIPATWAFVAALLDERSAAGRPGSKSCWYAPDLLERLLRAKTRHEIGSHSGRHPAFDRIGAEEAADDLGFAREIHRANGLPFTSMVFPRNAVGNLRELDRAGLRTFRGPDAGWATAIRQINRPLGQAANFADKLLPIPPSTVIAQRRDGLVDVPGSMLLMGRNGARRFVLSAVTRAKLGRGLSRAQQSGEIFHLWFHPANFYYRCEEQLATLDWFLEQAASELSRGHIEVRTMGSYAEQKTPSALRPEANA